MFGINLPSRGGKLVAVVEIGSGCAAVGLLSIQKDAPALMRAAERSILPMEERAKEATTTAIAGALVQAGESVLKRVGRQRLAALYCVIRTPWIHSEVVRAESIFERDTPVTQQMLAALAQQALSGLKVVDRANFLEAGVVKVELDGYPSGEPTGKRARRVAVSALASDCDPALKSPVVVALEQTFPHMRPIFRSSTRSILMALRDTNEASDHLVVDMVSEGATLLVVRDGVLSEQAFVPEGIRNILKRIAPTAVPEETLGLLRMLGKEQSSTTASDELQAAIARAEPELVRIFGEGMSACASLRRLPNDLVLIAHPDISPWFSKFFSRIDFTQFTQTTQPFVVVALSAPDLARFVMPDAGVRLDTGFALSAALVNREEGGHR